MATMTESQIALLKLTISSGSPEHPFVKALSVVLAGKGSKADAAFLADTVKKEPHWIERNTAIAALLGVDLEELVPPAKAIETPEILRGIVVELKSKLASALKSGEDAAKEIAGLKSKADELAAKLAASLKDNESLKALLEKVTKPEETPAKDAPKK